MKNIILTKNQQIFLNKLKEDSYLPQIFYLTGGTALAEFYLHHRLSEDLDFFTDKEFDERKVDFFINKMRTELKAVEVNREHIFDRFIYIFDFSSGVLKVEFVKYEFPNLKPLQIFDRLFVADIYDIAVNKLFTILDRTEAKDYVDLYFLLKRYGLEKLLAGVQKKYGFKIDPISLGGDLLKVRKTELMPKMIKRLTRGKLLGFFENEAYKLKKEILV